MHWILPSIALTVPVIAISGFADSFNKFTTSISFVSDILGSIANLEKLNVTEQIPEDAFLNITELTRRNGYSIEEHKVTTNDGYILTLHRIPHNSKESKSIVFLMHGILDSADSWILQGPGDALAYLLNDEGYDVWLGNARGNKYSSSHITLNTTDAEFWNFSWEEIGVHDLTSMIDYILNVTEKERLYYVGHSQGTTSFLVTSSLRPQYNEKIKMMFSLAPVAWMSHAKSPIINYFSSLWNIFTYSYISSLNILLPSTEFLNKIIARFCSLNEEFCKSYLFAITGASATISSSILPVIFGHLPSSASIFQLVHYGQLAESGRFCRFDYGYITNLMTYGQTTPPDYDLSKVVVPIVLYYSKNDWLSDASDVEILKSHLPNVYNYSVSNFSHLDYMYAPLAKDFIYSQIIQQIDEYEKIVI